MSPDQPSQSLAPSLQPIRNTLALPCDALCCYQVATIADCIALLKAWPDAQTPLVVGGGSNLVLPCEIEQPVLQIRAQAVETEALQGTQTRVIAEAGMQWDALVAYCVEHEFRGLENLSLIPGTVGAAPVQNIGAYGVELKDCLDYVEAYDFERRAVRTFSADECGFGYRDSIFKQSPGRYVILRVAFVLDSKANFVLSYGELSVLQDSDNLSVGQVRDKVIAVRQAKLPDPKDLPNAGSFFKNPVISAAQFERLQTQHPEVVSYALPSGHYKLAAGWLIDQAGWKGYRAKHVGVHERQALVLTNLGQASQSDILNLATAIQKDVFTKYGVELEIEPVVLFSGVKDKER